MAHLSVTGNHLVLTLTTFEKVAALHMSILHPTIYVTPLPAPRVKQLLREFQPDFTPGDETEAGEYYIDCVSVDSAHQGKGVGKKLITAFCELAASLGFEKVGLIVDKVNPAAKRLYEDLGFDVAGEKDFLGHRYFHMVRKVL